MEWVRSNLYEHFSFLQHSILINDTNEHSAIRHKYSCFLFQRKRLSKDHIVQYLIEKWFILQLKFVLAVLSMLLNTE